MECSKFNAIDYNNWDRKEIYETFYPCAYYMTVELDVTKFLAEIRAHKYKFYPTITYCMCKLVNSHAEYRFAIKDDKIGYYDSLSPLYTLIRANSDHLFTHNVTAYSDNFQDFYDRFLSGSKLAEQCNQLYYNNYKNENAFCVSITPTTTFKAISFAPRIEENKTNFVPFATIGKYYDNNDKIMMPIAVEFHHEVNDGYHAGKFFERLQIILDDFNINNSTK